MNGFGQNALDDAWRRGGAAGIRRAFDAMASRDKRAAAERLRDNRLEFPAIFVLWDDIVRHGLTKDLSPRNTAALYICAQKIKRLRPYAPESKPDDETLYGALRWMLDTGLRWEGPSAGGSGRGDYDAVIDYAAALAVKDYDDKAVLPDMAELIFRRNRLGLNIHDLVWCFFQTVNPDALELVAGYLNSSNPTDVALARTILGLERRENEARADRSEQRGYLDWLRVNKPYLFTTGEHLQKTSRPKHVDFDEEAKYLDKEISPDSRAPVVPLNEDEAESLARFRTTPAEERRLLTDYSYKLRGRDKGQWEAWMRKQVAEQVMAAQNEGKGEAV